MKFMARDWYFKVGIGDRVYDVADPRHVGRITRGHWDTTVDITWEETGWRSLNWPREGLRLAGR
jgi:hypothetical protein